MYIRGLIARNFAEFGDAVPIVKMVCPEAKTDSRIYVKVEKMFSSFISKQFIILILPRIIV